MFSYLPMCLKNLVDKLFSFTAEINCFLSPQRKERQGFAELKESNNIPCIFVDIAL